MLISKSSIRLKISPKQEDVATPASKYATVFGSAIKWLILVFSPSHLKVSKFCLRCKANLEATCFINYHPCFALLPRFPPSSCSLPWQLKRFVRMLMAKTVTLVFAIATAIMRRKSSPRTNHHGGRLSGSSLRVWNHRVPPLLQPNWRSQVLPTSLVKVLPQESCHSSVQRLNQLCAPPLNLHQR